MLYINALLLIAREREVELMQQPLRMPRRDLTAIIVILRGVALAEDQPIPVLAATHARPQVTAQARDAGSVADEDQRPIGRRRMKAGIGSKPHANRVTDDRKLSQPARADAERSVISPCLPDQQVHTSIARHRCNREFTLGQWLQPLHELLQRFALLFSTQHGMS